MSRRFEHSATYPCSAAALHAALVDETYWAGRVEHVGGPGARLESVEPRDGGLDVKLTQSIPAKHLPAVVSKIKSGDLVISRSERWSPLAQDQASATTRGAVQGTPATISATVELTGDSDTTTVRTTGKADVPVPFVGGKVEQAIVDNLTRLLDLEREYTAAWVREH